MYQPQLLLRPALTPLNEPDHRLFVVTRFPARLLVWIRAAAISSRPCPLWVIAMTYSSILHESGFTRSAARVRYQFLPRTIPTTTVTSAESLPSKERERASSLPKLTGCL